MNCCGINIQFYMYSSRKQDVHLDALHVRGLLLCGLPRKLGEKILFSHKAICLLPISIRWCGSREGRKKKLAHVLQLER